jgi:hypothetical protein
MEQLARRPAEDTRVGSRSLANGLALTLAIRAVWARRLGAPEAGPTRAGP